MDSRYSAKAGPRRMLVAFVISVSSLLASSAASAREPWEEALDDEARAIIALSTGGKTDEAFDRAQKLALDSDEAFRTKLALARPEIDARHQTAEGKPRVVSVDENHVGPCVHRTYAVRYKNLSEQWIFSWSTGSKGRKLKDISVTQTNRLF